MTADTAPLIEPYLTVEDMAAILKCSRSSVYNLDMQGAIPAGVKLGRLKRWDPREIAEWRAAGSPPRAQWNCMRPSAKTGKTARSVRHPRGDHD